MTKKPRARTERRAHERELAKLVREREKLARAEAGGAPSRPIELASASQVEGHARALGCAQCGGETRVVEHEAVVVDGRRLRVAWAVCPACGARREVWFVLAVVS
jgi:hypothetical protein